MELSYIKSPELDMSSGGEGYKQSIPFNNAGYWPVIDKTIWRNIYIQQFSALIYPIIVKLNVLSNSKRD